MRRSKRFQSVESLLDRFRHRYRVPAVGAAIVSADGEPFIHVAGRCRRDRQDEVQVDDKWHIGSCTKSLTAALWARLVEFGLARWDMPLCEIFEGVPSMHDDWTEVTIRHALQCRAGFTPNLNDEAFEAAHHDDRELPDQRLDVVEQLLTRRPIGRGHFFYSNVSYIVVGSAIDQVTQTSYEEALQRHILQPLEVQSAGFGAPERICGHQSRLDRAGYMLFAGPPVPPDGISDNPSVYSSAGTMHVSLNDWSTLIKMFLADNENRLLHEESLHTIFEAPDESDRCMTMGWSKEKPGSDMSYSMQGSNTVWAATAALSPDRKRCALFVCNDGRTRVLNRSVPLARNLLKL